MKGDQPLAIPLSGFWSPLKRIGPWRGTDNLVIAADAEHQENAWDELVHWFEHQREWAEVAASLEAAFE